MGAVHQVVKAAEACGLKGWSLPAGVDEHSLAALLYPASSEAEVFAIDFDWVHQERQKKAVTLRLLWQELQAQGLPYCYSHCCELYARWKVTQQRSMRQVHEPGDTAFVDYCGLCVAVGDKTAQIFVGVLGASSDTFVVAVWTQQLRDWLSCLSEMLTFFGGCPRLIVSDNLRSAVTRPCRDDPQFNPTYQQWADHDGVAVKATRPRKPKDKAKVEAGVLQAERWILARLRNRRFTGLAELNAATMAR